MAIFILAYSAIVARSVALAGFGLDSLIEIGASAVVLWELRDGTQPKQQRALRLIGIAFIALAIYLSLQSSIVLLSGFHSRHSSIGIVWTLLTAAVMFLLAAGKAKAGKTLQNPVLETEGRVTFVDGVLATAVLVGLTLNATMGWWWADPAAGYILVFYAAKEAKGALSR